MLRFVRADSACFKTTSWSGGATTELYIHPEGASYAERRFDFRISSAEVELESSVFTSLPSVKRFLTPLCGEGFRLVINGAEELFLPRGRVLEFSGDDAVACFGKGRDLNLMLKGAEGCMRCIAAGERASFTGAKFQFLYASEDGSIVPALRSTRGAADELANELPVKAGDFIRVHGSGGFISKGSVVLFSVRAHA